ncbi:MAG: type II secretion system protein GspI [Gammaproteobacteria bacterium]|nr:type II secretion system protein GspI [Gammaproteobacteria bacterium]
MRRTTTQRGFTLMEVLVAMVVLSFGMMAVIKVVSEVSTSAIQLQDKTYAQWVALNKVAEMRLQTTWPSTGKSEGVMAMAGRDWHWAMEIKNTDDKDVRKLEVSVNPESEKDSKVATIVVTAFLGKPL